MSDMQIVGTASMLGTAATRQCPILSRGGKVNREQTEWTRRANERPFRNTGSFQQFRSPAFYVTDAIDDEVALSQISTQKLQQFRRCQHLRTQTCTPMYSALI
eukprot:Polyplicarium_translucidae@DN5535_c0_g1_i1.p1